MNKAENLVYKLCHRSFLSLWSYANPKGKEGKELCDILVVCDPDIIIFSVKEIKIAKTGKYSLDKSRWQKRAIEKSCSQIYGAERWINSAKNVIRKDGTIGLAFPESSLRRIHRVAIALGSQGKIGIKFGDFGKGFIHVFDEQSLDIIMSELDTISDFIEYLTSKEYCYKNGIKTHFSGGEEDLGNYKRSATGLVSRLINNS